MNNKELIEQISLKYQLSPDTAKSVVELANILTNNNRVIEHQGTNGGINFLSVCSTDPKSDDTKEIVKFVNSVLRSELLLYKNKLGPIYMDIVDQLCEFKSRTETSKNPITRFIVKQIEIPEGLAEHEAYNTIPDYTPSKDLYRHNRSIIKDITIPNIFTNKSFTNMAIVDDANKLLTEFLSKYEIKLGENNEEKLANLKQDIIRILNTKESPYGLYMYENLNLIMLSYYILKENMNTNKIPSDQNTLQVLRDIGGALIMFYNNYKLETDKNMLILYTDSKNYTVYINKAIFDSTDDTEYLIEAILGYTVSSDKSPHEDKYLDNLIAKKNIYLEKWEAFVAAANTPNMVELYKNYMGEYERVIVAAYRDMEPELRNYSGYGENLTAFVFKLREILNTLKYDTSLSNLRHNIDIIASTLLFSKTNYGKMLTLVEKYLKLKPDAQMNDIIPFISIELVVDVLTKNLKTFDIN